MHIDKWVRGSVIVAILMGIPGWVGMFRPTPVIVQQTASITAANNGSNKNLPMAADPGPMNNMAIFFDLMRYLGPILSAALLLGVAATLRNRPPIGSPLYIDWAHWGIGDWLWEYRRITKKVRESVRGGTLDIPATIQYLGDPFPGVPKHLTVRCFLNGVPMTIIKAEGERLVLPERDAKLVSLPDSPLAIATHKTFKSLSISQRLLLKYIYEHPNTETTFLLPVLNDMGFPPRVGAEALNKLLTTNLVSRNNLHTFPNPEVRSIVEALINLEPWPTYEVLWSINREVVGAVQIDCNHSYNTELAKILDEGNKKYHSEQEAHQATKLERDKAIKDFNSAIADRDASFDENATLQNVIADLATKLCASEIGSNTAAPLKGASSAEAL